MKFAPQSILSAGLLGLVLLLRVTAAPITNDLEFRAEAFFDLGLRGDGLREDGMMVVRDLTEDSWKYRREEIMGNELYGRAEDDLYVRLEYDELQHRTVQDNPDIFFARTGAPLDTRSPSHSGHAPEDEDAQLAARGIKQFFQKVWGGIKKVAGKVVQAVASKLRRDLGDVLSERELCSRDEEFVYGRDIDGSQLVGRGIKQFFQKVWGGIKKAAGAVANVAQNVVVNKAASGASFVGSKIKI